MVGRLVFTLFDLHYFYLVFLVFWIVRLTIFRIRNYIDTEKYQTLSLFQTFSSCSLGRQNSSQLQEQPMENIHRKTSTNFAFHTSQLDQHLPPCTNIPSIYLVKQPVDIFQANLITTISYSREHLRPSNSPILQPSNSPTPQPSIHSLLNHTSSNPTNT